jgi:hypothetical protein
VTAPVDPQMLAAMNGAAPTGPEPVVLDTVAQELLRAIRTAATNVTTEQNSAAEAQSWATAAKALADAYVVLDPGLDPSGVPLVDQQAHEMAMAAQEQQHKTELERVRAQQAAPAQKRKKLRMSKNESGGTDYTMEG